MKVVIMLNKKTQKYHKNNKNNLQNLKNNVTKNK